MFKVRKTKKKSSASGARVSSAAHTTEEPDDLRSVQDDGHDSDSQTSAGEGHVSTTANTVLDGDAEPDVYMPPQRPRLYVAAAPRLVFTREHHLQLAGRLYEMEMERVFRSTHAPFPSHKADPPTGDNAPGWTLGEVRLRRIGGDGVAAYRHPTPRPRPVPCWPGSRHGPSS